jgi:hypothetical protein
MEQRVVLLFLGPMELFQYLEVLTQTQKVMLVLQVQERTLVNPAQGVRLSVVRVVLAQLRVLEEMAQLVEVEAIIQVEQELVVVVEVEGWQQPGGQDLQLKEGLVVGVVMTVPVPEVADMELLVLEE